MMREVHLILEFFLIQIKSTFHINSLRIIQCVSTEGLLVTIQKFRIRVQRCYCSSLSSHGVQNVCGPPRYS